MVIAGLTGGIGSGKSTVTRMFEQEGAYIIDFDHLARLVVEPGEPAWKEIIAYFGPEILAPDKTLNRSALAEIVFSDEASRKALEGFTHPRIFERQDVLVEAIKRKDPLSVVIIDVPLLFELNLQEKFDRVILVYVSWQVQIERVMERDGLSIKEAEQRLKAQMPIENKKALSDFTIHTAGSLEDTRAHVKKVFHELKALVRKER